MVISVAIYIVILRNFTIDWHQFSFSHVFEPLNLFLPTKHFCVRQQSFAVSEKKSFLFSPLKTVALLKNQKAVRESFSSVCFEELIDSFIEANTTEMTSHLPGQLVVRNMSSFLLSIHFPFLLKSMSAKEEVTLSSFYRK